MICPGGSSGICSDEYVPADNDVTLKDFAENHLCPGDHIPGYTNKPYTLSPAIAGQSPVRRPRYFLFRNKQQTASVPDTAVATSPYRS